MRLKRLPMRGRKRTESMMSNVKQMRRNEEQKIKHSMTSYASSFRNSRRSEGHNYRSYSYSYSDKASRGTNTYIPHKELKLFGLESSATLQDVKKRYRTLAKQHHPDTGGDAEAIQEDQCS